MSSLECQGNLIYSKVEFVEEHRELLDLLGILNFVRLHSTSLDFLLRILKLELTRLNIFKIISRLDSTFVEEVFLSGELAHHCFLILLLDFLFECFGGTNGTSRVMDRAFHNLHSYNLMEER